MGWFDKKTPMTPREVAEDVKGSDGPTRVLAAAIDAADHAELGQYHMRHLEGLGDDEIDDLMGELVLAGLAEWIQRPQTALSGRRNVGLIRPKAKGRRLLQTAIDEEREAKSVRGRAVRAARLIQSVASFLRDLKTVRRAVFWGAIVALAGVVVLTSYCPN